MSVRRRTLTRLLAASVLAVVPAALARTPAPAAALDTDDVAGPWSQRWIQCKGVAFTVAWSGVLTLGILNLVEKTIGLRVDAEEEQIGLDLSLHDGRGYNLS